MRHDLYFDPKEPPCGFGNCRDLSAPHLEIFYTHGSSQTSQVLAIFHVIDQEKSHPKLLTKKVFKITSSPQSSVLLFCDFVPIWVHLNPPNFSEIPRVHSGEKGVEVFVIC